jgi:hypothetical protein
MRNTLVPQAGQSPLVAGRPFFNVTCSGLDISRFSRHFRQYASMAYPLREVVLGAFGRVGSPALPSAPDCLRL